MQVQEPKAIYAEQVRFFQEQRLASAAQAVNEARKRLADATADVEWHEREYREIQENVSRNLHALELVLDMASDLEGQKSQLRLSVPERPTAALLPEGAQWDHKTANKAEKSATAGPTDKQSKGHRLVLRSALPFWNSRGNRLSILQLD